MKKCVLVYNPESGKSKTRLNKKVLSQIAAKYEYQLDYQKTSKHSGATFVIQNLPDEIDLVVPVGGDGTLHEAIVGNLKRKHPLLISHLPQGTVNDVGKMYGLTKNIEKDFELILSGTIRNIDTCIINSEPFVYVACFGNFVNISFDTPRNLKERYGKLGYIIYALKNYVHKVKKYHIKYIVDGKEWEDDFSFVFITNTNHVAGVNYIYNDVKLDDGLFEVVLCKAKSIPEIATLVTTILATNNKNLKNVVYFKTNNLVLEFDKIPKESWCVDGEEFKHHTNRFVFSVNKNINMLIPHKNVEKLFESNIEK